MAVRVRLQDRPGDRPGRRLRHGQVHRGQGDLRNAGRPPGHDHPDPYLRGRDVAAAVRDRADGDRADGDVSERSVPGHDLGPGVRLPGGTPPDRGAQRHAVRQLHPVVGRGQVGGQDAAAGQYRRAVDAVRLGPDLRAPDAGGGAGPGAVAAAHAGRRGRAGQARADERQGPRGPVRRPRPGPDPADRGLYDPHRPARFPRQLLSRDRSGPSSASRTPRRSSPCRSCRWRRSC